MVHDEGSKLETTNGNELSLWVGQGMYLGAYENHPRSLWSNLDSSGNHSNSNNKIKFCLNFLHSVSVRLGGSKAPQLFSSMLSYFPCEASIHIEGAAHC